MTVAELIELLKAQPQEREVLMRVWCYEVCEFRINKATDDEENNVVVLETY